MLSIVTTLDAATTNGRSGTISNPASAVRRVGVSPSTTIASSTIPATNDGLRIRRVQSGGRRKLDQAWA